MPAPGLGHPPTGFLVERCPISVPGRRFLAPLSSNGYACPIGTLARTEYTNEAPDQIRKCCPVRSPPPPRPRHPESCRPRPVPCEYACRLLPDWARAYLPPPYPAQQPRTWYRRRSRP